MWITHQQTFGGAHGWTSRFKKNVYRRLSYNWNGRFGTFAPRIGHFPTNVVQSLSCREAIILFGDHSSDEFRLVFFVILAKVESFDINSLISTLVVKCHEIKIMWDARSVLKCKRWASRDSIGGNSDDCRVNNICLHKMYHVKLVHTLGVSGYQTLSKYIIIFFWILENYPWYHYYTIAGV